MVQIEWGCVKIPQTLRHLLPSPLIDQSYSLATVIIDLEDEKEQLAADLGFISEG